MKILNITLHNLNSLRVHQTIDFTTSPLSDSGLFAITGDTGSGKTTILDALTLALYGRIHRNKDVSEVMTYGETESLAEVEFQTNKGTYRASWKMWRAHKKVDGKLRDSRSLAQLDSKVGKFIPIAEKKREVDVAVEEVSGLDYDRFCRSVLLSQGDFAAFLKAGEKERSDLLERITGREIYTRLSKAAFERNKIENEKLENLNSRRSNLNLLAPEVIKDLKTSLKENKKNSTQLKKELNSLRKQKQQYEKFLEIESKKQGKEKALEVLNDTIETSFSDFERLTEYIKIRSFQTPLSRLNQHLEQQNETQKAILKLKVELPPLKESKALYSRSLKEKQASHKVLKEQFKTQKPLFEKIVKLDLLLEEKSTAFEVQSKEFKAFQTEVDELKARIEQSEMEKKRLKEEKNQLEEWLTSNAVYEKLATDLVKIELHREDLRKIFREKLKIEKQLKQNKEGFDAINAKLKNLSQKQEKEKAVFAKMKTVFEASTPQKIAKNREEVIERHRKDIDGLQKLEHDLKQLYQINEQYEQLLGELAKREQELDSLRNEEFDIAKQLMSSAETLEAIENKQEFKIQIYEQQQLIANYEKDRSELKEGDPCPLCFSQKHPFRQKKILPFVDEAKMELDNVRKQRELIYNNHKKLINRHNDVAVKIENLIGNELQQAGGQLEEQVEKITGFENKMSVFARSIDTDLFSMSRSGVLSKKLNALKSEVEKEKKVLTTLQKLSIELNEKEKSVLEIQSMMQEVQTEVVSRKQTLKHDEEQLKKLEERFASATEEINKLLKKYGEVFETDTAAIMFQSLVGKKESYENKFGLVKETGEKLGVSSSSLKEIKSQFQAGEKKLKSLKEKVEKANQLLKENRKERKTLFGDKDPIEQRNELESQIEKQNIDIAELQEKAQKNAVQLDTFENLLIEKEKEVKSNLTKIQLGTSKLSAQIKKKGFESIDELREKMMEEKEAMKIETHKKQLDEQQIALKQTLADLEKDWKILKPEFEKIIDVEALNQSLKEKEQNYSEIEREQGATNEKIREHNIRKEQSKDLLVEIEQQKIVCSRWGKLNELIGQADGKKFRIFAQGLTLKKLVGLANIHLTNLNDRYFIHKPDDQLLDLEIIDTFQADNRRSMLSLSGGESFLVSLALALGLSDLAGHKAQIKSLFIDEGFGTLDENSLDLALSTLENLRSSGKTIGLISHVNTLKERIGTQIQVIKSGNGLSQIQISD
jgi:exonuclease SbcC